MGKGLRMFGSRRSPGPAWPLLVACLVAPAAAANAQTTSRASPEFGWQLVADQGGPRVVSLAAGGPAARAGVSEGDRLLAVDERRIDSPDDLRRLLRHPAEPPSLLRVGRFGIALLLTVELPAPRAVARDAFEGVPEDAFATRGVDGTLIVAGCPLSAAVTRSFFGQLPASPCNVVVVQVGGGDPKTTRQQQTALWEAWSTKPGVSLQSIQLNDRQDAENAAQWSCLDQAQGVWLLGGAPDQIAARFLIDTPALQAIRRLLRRDGVVGASAEASQALCSAWYNATPSTDAAHNQAADSDDAGPSPLNQSGLTPDSADVESAIVVRDGMRLLPEVCLDVGPQANLDQPLRQALGQCPELVLLHLPPESGVLVRGRRVQGLGPTSATATVSSANGWPELSVRVNARQAADLTALRRYARRRQEPVFPPAAPGPPEVPQGTLVIVGGGGMPDGLVQRFVDLAGGEHAVIAVIPIAMPEPLPPEDALARAFRRAGAAEVIELRGRTPEQVLRPESLQVLRRATGLWFGGGRQWRFIDAYEGTAAADLMHQVLSRGGVIGGSSAGASIQGDYMARGDPRGSGPIMAAGYERGLGFLPGVAIDQHFRQRNRFADMHSLMERYPQLLGIGVDETTALLVQGEIGEVVGQGSVHFFNWRDGKPSDETPYDSVNAGQKYQLVHRRPVE